MIEKPRNLNTHAPSSGVKKTGYSWKIGDYEPSIPQKHGDIAWFYVVDLNQKKILFSSPDEIVKFVDNETITPENVQQLLEEGTNIASLGNMIDVASITM